MISSCILGSMEAWALLYKLYAPMLFGICLRYCRTLVEAEDAFQEGFIRIYEKIGTFRGAGSFEGWMRRLMLNLVLTRNKRMRRFCDTDLNNLDLEDADDVDFMPDFDIADLMKLVDELPSRYRMVFSQWVFDGKKHREIAATMQISEGTSKSDLSRARTLLRKKIFDEIKRREDA
ncbi:MAG: sigma-70 family RNA polymerase sigma factor [Bacteroidales bacterium]|nr:sigma-70 family RNA polymerase sigma factor [Bacteroidales bacterium]